MTEEKKRIIEENIDGLEFTVKTLLSGFNITGDEAEEYRQTGYLALCKKVDKYDGSTKFTTFAGTVLRNTFIDKYRHDKVRNGDCISIDEICCENDNGDGVSLAQFLATKNDTESEVLTKITNELIRKNIKDAKEKCSAQTTVKGFEALELKLAGYSGEEIARLFNVPSNSIRSWMSRAKKILLTDYGVQDLITE